MAWLRNPCNLEGHFFQAALIKLSLEILPKGRVCPKDLGALVNGKLSESVHNVRVCLSCAPVTSSTGPDHRLDAQRLLFERVSEATP